jgi:peptidyl-prolyl cis-trans isomerase B (cyclophilin B)
MRSRLILPIALIGAALSFGTLSLAAEEKSMANVNPVVVMETSEGAIKIELWPDKAPKTVENFLSYVDEKFYDGTIFHRVIENFMIQGGGMTPDMSQKETHPQIKNEAKSDVKNVRGTIAMARTGVVDSATAQFFINVVDNSFLDHTGETPRSFGYAVFGKVIDGMDVVDKIKEVKTGANDIPVKVVLIKSVRRVEPVKQP